MNKKLETNQQPWKLRTTEKNIRTFLFPTSLPPPVIYAESGHFLIKILPGHSITLSTVNGYPELSFGERF